MADTTLPGLMLSGLHSARPAASAVGGGTLYAETDTFKIYQSDTSSWTEWLDASGSGAMTNPMTTTGDTVYSSDNSGTPARLGIGGAGAIQQVVSGIPGWKAAPVGASYKRTSGDYTTTSATMVAVDGTNMALTITTLARRVRIGFVGSVSHSGTSAISLDVDIDGVLQGNAVASGVGGSVTARSGNANYWQNVSFTYLSSVLTAASHTFTLEWCTAAATAKMGGGTSTSPDALFWVEETLLTA